MGLLENIITLVNKYFYKTEEKPVKYNEWLTSEYINGVWYFCEEMPLIFTFTGTELTQHSNGSFNGTDMYIDYGDGTIETTTGKFGHTYEENGVHKVKIYGVTNLGGHCFRDCTGLTSIIIPSRFTNLGNYCFKGCTGLTSIIIPSGVTNLGNYCFWDCTGLTSIILNWVSNDILTYNSSWINNESTKFIIPQDTTEYYIQAGYPSNELVESD